MLKHVSFSIYKVDEAFVTRRPVTLIWLLACVNSSMNEIIFFPRKTLRTAFKFTMIRSFQSVVLSNVVNHFVFLVEASRAEGASILLSEVNVVQVVVEVRFEPERLATAIADKHIQLQSWLSLQSVLLFVISERCHRRHHFTTERAGIFFPLAQRVLGVLISDVELQIFLNFELFSAS